YCGSGITGQIPILRSADRLQDPLRKPVRRPTLFKFRKEAGADVKLTNRTDNGEGLPPFLRQMTNNIGLGIGQALDPCSVVDVSQLFGREGIVVLRLNLRPG